MKSTPEFVEALFQLTRERGGGYIVREEIEARAATVRIRRPPPPLPRLPPPPLPRLPI